MSVVQRSLLALLVIFATACSSAPGPATSAPADRNAITEAELTPFAGQPVRQAIQRLRPQFLRVRGPSTITNSAEAIVVYLGTTRMGGISVLETIPSNTVKSVQYLSPSDATQRFGLDHNGGAIVLTPR